MDNSELNRSQFPLDKWLIPRKSAPSPQPSSPGKSKFAKQALEASSLFAQLLQLVLRLVFVQTSPGMTGTGFQVKYKRRVIECLRSGYQWDNL